MEKQEKKLYKRLLKTKDSVFALKRLSELNKEYSSFRQERIDSSTTISQVYIPALDSFKIALHCNSSVDPATGQALEKLKGLSRQFNQSERIKAFITARRQQIRDLWGNTLPAKYWQELNKQIYYYDQQIMEYKALLQDPDKLMKKALAVLRETKLFQELFRNNSELAALFRLPGDPAQVQLQGLQSRLHIDQLIQQQIGGQAGLQQLQQNLNAAQGELNKLKDKVIKAGGTASDGELPEGFRPNSQKTKPFLKRLEWGMNWQSQRTTQYFPLGADLGFSLGYKASDRKQIGIGAAYKMGFGKGWNHLAFSSEGLALRSFFEWKWKSAYWFYGSYEMNYQTRLQNIVQLKDGAAWRRSGLLGLTRNIPIKNKIFKNTRLMLLWDFLAEKQIPKANHLIFRIGYSSR